MICLKLPPFSQRPLEIFETQPLRPTREDPFNGAATLIGTSIRHYLSWATACMARIVAILTAERTRKSGVGRLMKSCRSSRMPGLGRDSEGARGARARAKDARSDMRLFFPLGRSIRNLGSGLPSR